jgi:phosphoglycolate phosphatase-like HAD superfamily hydrolase
MKDLENNKTILWDFDGVIMDSMPVRDKGFELVLKNYPKEQVSLLMNYHRNNGGLSRYHKFRYFFEQIRKESVTEMEIQRLAEEFSKVMLGNLLDPNLLIMDSVKFIENQYRNFNMHIVSGSDQEELRYICKILGLSKYFISIHGSPTPKKELVKDLLDINSYLKEETCLIGDSLNDLEAAHVNEITFFGYNNSKLILPENQYVELFDSFYPTK